MRKFFAILTLVFAACIFTRSATITGPIYLAYSNRPYSGKILIRPLSTPLPYSPNLVTGGDFTVSTDTNGLFSVDLQPGNYRVQVGADRPFVIDVPTNAASYTLLERITNSLTWNSSIVPATNSYQLALSTRSGVAKTYTDQADPIVWTTNDTATIGRWLGAITYKTIDQLLATSAPTHDVDNIVINGWSTEQDGRGGQWWYDYGATTTTNRGMVVAWGSGRLYRRWEKEVDPKWFGANESCGASASSEIQEAIDFAADPTYGWQASTGEAGQTSYTVKLPGCYVATAPLIPKGAVEIAGPKRGSGAGDFGANGIIHVKHGGSAFRWDVSTDAPYYRSPTIRDIFLTGYSETYQSNKKSITGVSSRTVFTVADADAPPTLDDPTIWASNNTCFFFDNEGGYLGSGRIASTSSSLGTTTVTLATGSDIYTSVNGSSGNRLTTACKVVWPVRITAESAGSVGDFNDPSAAGSTAIYLENTTGSVFGIPRIENVYGVRFHAGLRIGPKLLGAQNGGFKDLKFSYSRFAGIATPRPPNTADMFFQGVIFTSGYYAKDFGTTRTNTADVPALRYATYGVWGVPDLSKWDSLLAEESAYANVYSHRTIAPSFGYLFADGIIRYGIALGPGYYAYSGTTTSALDNWFSVGRLLLKNQLDNLTIDTIHTDQTGVYFELTDTAKFASIAVDQLHVIKSGTTHPAITAFNLQPAAYNNRARIAQVIERNGVATWSQAGSKVPEVDVPNHSTAADVDTGFYQPATTQRDYAVSGTRLLSLTPGNVLIEKAGGLNLFTLSNTTTTNAVSMTIGTGSIAFDDAVNSRRIGSLSSSATDATIQIGSAGYSGTARGSQINSENPSGTDAAAGTLQIYGPRPTGNSTTGGGIDIYTAVTGSSGTALQSSTAKVRIPRVGGIALPGQSSDPSALIAGHYFFNSTARNFRFYDGSYWQPMSVQGDEVTVASASTVNLGFQTSDKVYITGTTTINSFGAALGGTRRNVRFEGALTLTYNATSMVLPTGTNIVTAAGDNLEAVCISTNSAWRVIWYQRASGASLVGGGGGGLTDGDKGDITVSGGGTGLAIDAGAVTYSKMQTTAAASIVLGRGAGAGAGSLQELTLGSGLSMSGTTLSVSAGGGNVSVSGTPSAGQVAEWASPSTIQGVSATGSGNYVRATSPSISGALLSGSTITNSSINGLTLSGTPGSTLAIGSGGTLGTLAYQSGTFSGTSSGINTGDQTITLTGDVTGSGTGSFAATIANAAVSNTKMANVSTATFKGRTTAGTGSPEDLTATQATALLNAMVGDSGSGGTKGLVPAPSAGDAAASKFLKADGTWAAPSGGGTGGNPTASVGLTAVNGSASTFLRSDGAPALNQGITPTWTAQHINSYTSTASTPAQKYTGSWFTGGSGTTTKPHVLIEASGTTSTGWPAGGTAFGVNAATGFGGSLINLQANGVQKGSFSVTGTWTVEGAHYVGTAQAIGWQFGSLMRSPSSGTITMNNAVESGFTRLNFGGTSTSFPAIGISSTTVAVQLADGSAGGKLSVGKTQAKVGGTIDQKFSSTGTPASTTETDLHSFTTVASSLGTDGDGFTMTSGGTFAGNASATSQLRVYFGGTQIFASGALTAASAASWHIECMIIRDSSTTVRCVTKFTTASAVSAPLVTQTDVTGLTLSSSNILKVTGQGGGASPASNDIVYKLGRIRFEPVY